MPKYELMYILSSAVSDNDAPQINSEVDKFIKDEGGTILTSELLGKKKLAYPIKKTRNGFYILQTFNFDSPKLAALDNKLRSLDSIIRYLVVNVEELERRKAKDAAYKEKMKPLRRPKPEVKPAGPEIKLTETELEQKIAKALGSEDLTK
ncbi:MAG: 30S ribosomal protein S6 [Candidatus Doudnabacteria bacterium]|nr:30S ribosomal protein S6 [Candidatus Doudnabacteria bacterium]